MGLALASCGAGRSGTGTHPAASVPEVATQGSNGETATSTTTSTATTSRPPAPKPPFAVAERVVTLIDSSREVTYPGEVPQPRKLVTIVRYPLAPGPFPLVVFGHGFAVTPQPYSQLLQAWARAGYVVAAPFFPLENANAPGGPNESDLVNQPRDMSFLITQMVALGRSGQRPFGGLIEPRAIAVSGQSDGGDTALTVTYHPRFRDPRIRAAVILSGQEIPGLGGYDFGVGPPLLATQGLADTINVPSTTYAFFDAAAPPKYLLTLPGTPHLPPYTYEQPQLGVIERVTIAFLDAYLKHDRGALARMEAAGNIPGVAAMQSDPG